MYRVYKYGVRRLVSGEATINDQIYRMNRYWNRLVEIEQGFQLKREFALREGNLALAQAQTGVDAAMSALEQAQEAVSQHKQATRAGKAPPLLQEAVKVARSALKVARDSYRTARKDAFTDDVKAQLGLLAQERTATIREARHVCELYWGNYLDVEFHYKTARQRFANRLKFHRASPEGKVSVWFQDGLPVADVQGKDSRLTLLSAAPFADHEKGNARLINGWLRLGTDPDTKMAILAQFEVILHRPLPTNGVIRHASLARRRIGTKWRYDLLVDVATPDPIPATATLPLAALDIGWRQTEDGLRVAMLVDTDGTRRELTLPPTYLTRCRKIEDLQSIRDQNFNIAKAVLGKAVAPLELPEWFSQQAATLAQWRSPARLAGLTLRWRDNRFSGDTEAYERCEAWRKQDKHLLEWESNQRENTQQFRLNVYRNFAAEVSRQYPALALEDFDLRSMAQADMPESIKWMWKVAALSELRTALAHAYSKAGQTIIEVDPAFTTKTCAVCAGNGVEALEEFDAARNLRHKCSRCGTEYDQDENAARNLLRLAQAGFGTVTADDVPQLETAA